MDILKRAINRDVSGLELLEIGPGNGFFAEAAREQGVNFYGVENSESLSHALREKGFNVVCEDLSNTTFGDKQFDVIYMSHVLEHCDTRAEAVQLLVTCYKKLKDGGVIMINAPNVLSHKFDFWLADYTHNFVTTPLRIKTLLIDCGFQCMYEQKTVLLFRNAFMRKLTQFSFALIPNQIIEFIANSFFKDGKGYFKIFGHENFSIVAKKSRQA